MDVSTDGRVLSVEDFQIDSSWVPKTPVKPSLTAPKPICADGQENEAVHGNSFDSQIISQGNEKGKGRKLQMERLPGRFQEETHAQNVAAPCESTDFVNISRDFDRWEAAIAAKSEVYGANASIYNKLSLDDADKWPNVSFAKLLALAHAAAVDTGGCNATTSSLNDIVDSQIEGSYFQKLPVNSSLSNRDFLHATKCWSSCDQVSDISIHGSSIPCRPSFDLNSPPRTSDLTSRESIQSCFAPITPDPASRAYKEQISNIPSMSILETRDVEENGITVRDVELNELLQKNERSQLLVDQSSAGISTELEENHAPDKGGSDSNKTPQQKPRRRKHRPKVVIEGQPKRTPKPRTPKPAAPEGSVPGKRKYVRKNGGSKVTATPTEKGTDGTASTAKPPGSEEMPVGKRKYVRRKGVNNLAATSLEDKISRNDQMVGQQTKYSCRRSLNFDSECQVKNDSSSGLSSNFDNETRAENFSAQDHSSLNTPLQHAESRVGKPEGGIAYDLIHSMNQELERYLSNSGRQASAPSTSPKNHQPYDKSTEGYQNECTRGKCQIVFSNATHDKEVNVVQMMMSADAQSLRKSPPSSSNCSSSACLTQETEARGSKRQHSLLTEAEFCSRNVSGAHYNSLPTYLPIISPNECNRNRAASMHFPEIHKKRRTEMGHKSATCRAESSVAATENCSTNKSSPFNNVREKLFTSERTYRISAAQCDSGGAPPTYAFVHCGAQEKQNFNCLLAVGDNQRLTKKRSKGPTRARSSFHETCEQLLIPSGGLTIFKGKVLHRSQGCMEGSAQNHAIVKTKKRSKRNSSIAPPLAITWKSLSPIDEMIERFCRLDINTPNSRLGYHEQNALISYRMDYPEQNALVVYQRDGTIVPFNDSFVPSRKRRSRPKVDLDDETSRVWKLLLEDINSEGIDGTDEEKTKWWEEERRVFRGRADSFIARMHLVQGDRRFSPWKGSVLDSVIGVFLTQNVSDHLSSSAFMSLAAQYPLKSNSKQKELHEQQTCIRTKEPEFHVLDPDDAIAWHKEKSNQSICGQGSITQQYVEHHEEKVANSSEALRSSSCGIRSTDNSTGQLRDSSKGNINVYHKPAVNGSATEMSQPLVSSVGDQTESDDILSSQNSVDSSLAHTENFELCSLSTFEGKTTAETKTKHFSSPTFVELLQMAGTTMLHGVCNQGSGNGSLSMYGSSQSECDVSISENTDWPNDTEAFPSNITPCSDSGLHVIRSLGAQEGSGCSDKDLCAAENSGLSAESVNQTTLERTRTVPFEEVPNSTSENENSIDHHQIEVNLNIMGDPKINVEPQIQLQENNYKMHQVLDSPTLLSSTSEVIEGTFLTDNSRNHREKPSQSSLNACYDQLDSTVDAENASTSKGKRGRSGKQKQKVVDWDYLRKEVLTTGMKRERTSDTMDSLDWEAVRCADVKEIAETIKARGMNNMLAERIKDLLNRLMREHGSIDLEWLRDVPPDKAKEYLLSVRGLGLKSVECVRLLTLHHLAFPVDTNVGRIAVRLGWVPLQPLPESLQLHLLELYPILESIQKYLWPRLCKLDQRTLYELHYQMITFGKVFCTKNKPNCNACPMRGECRHFASAFASARLALPAPEEKSIMIATKNQAADRNPVEICSSSKLCLPQADEQNSDGICSSSNLCLPQANEHLRAHSESSSSNPIVVVPATPEPTVEEPGTPEPDQTQMSAPDIEEFEDPDEIPTIKLNMEEFTQNLQMFVGKNMELQEHEMSKALVALTAEAASIPTPKLKNISRLRTEHNVYELPDSHPLLHGLEKREPDDPCPYLLAIWIPGETANSIQPPERTCNFKESGRLCDEETCFSCNSIREANSQTVRGTLLIPCRTAMRGSFPLNGTYFQVNEVFADHESSLNPIDVPRAWIWNLPRRTVYFGTSVPTIFRGLSTEEIQYCFWRGFVCVRGFEQKTRAPRPLMARLHFPASKNNKTKGRMDGNEN